MKIIIDIPKDVYKETLRTEIWNEYEKRAIRFAIRNCTPLPKGYGRVIDENKITKCEQIGLIIKDGNVTRCLKTDAPTIIGADKEE